jgi:peptide/nickel transport system permease protein
MSGKQSVSLRTEAPVAPLRRGRHSRPERLLVIGGVLVGITVVAALVGLVFTPYDPLAMQSGIRGQGPSLAHLMGTDQFGRDILSRLMVSSSTALMVGLVAVGIGLVGGGPLGALAGLAGGWVDEAIMRVMDALFAFPALLLAMAIIAALGPGLSHAILAIGVAYVPVFARLTRATVLNQVGAEYVEAARAAGCTRARIFWTHMLPNGLSPIIVQATVSFGGAVLSEAALSYLGLGVQPPNPSWGQMLNDAGAYMTIAPWLSVFPGIAMALTVLGLNLLGDGLRDRLDPERRSRME